MYRIKDKELLYIALAGISVVFAYPALYWLALRTMVYSVWFNLLTGTL